MPSIDEQVVKLTMDNKDFDKNTIKSINNLDELKKALEFKDAGKGLDNITKAAAKVDLNPLQEGAQKAAYQFDAMATMADAALRRLTNSVIDTGERMVKSLTVDQISSGWDKFADKTAAVQTIMAATSKQFDDTGEQMKYVEEQLESLNWFTDETSYRFLDMVQNIGKFTSNNIGLEESVNAMQGISAWAARSGANVNEAGRAMYNLSQAISVGAVKLMDWKSIENANMATAEFKETAIETAVELGTLTKVSDGLYKTMNNHEVSVRNFNENLSDAWFSSEVLLKSLEKYGGFATELYKLTEEQNASTTALIGYIDDYAAGTIDMNEAVVATGMSIEQLTPWLEKLSAEEYKLGREAFKAAQESKTFGEVIDYVKEAVSSGWMRSFEYIFGNYEESKAFWSDLAEWMYDVFVASGDVRNGLLAMWKDEGGRDTFIEALWNILDAITEIMDAVKSGWEKVFPQASDASGILRITEGFKTFTEILKPTEITLTTISNVIEFLATALSTVGKVLKTTFVALSPILDVLDRIAGVVVYLIGYIAKLATMSLNTVFNEKRLEGFYNVLNSVAKVLAVISGTTLIALVKVLDQVLTGVENFFNLIEANGGGIQGFFLAIVQSVQNFWDSLLSGETFINQFINTLAAGIGGLATIVVGAVAKIVEAITGIKMEGMESTGIGQFFQSAVEIIDSLDLPGKVQVVINAIFGFADAIYRFIASLGDTESSTRQVLGSMKNELLDFYQWIKAGLSELTIKDVKDIALVILLGEFVFGLRELMKGLTTAVKGIGGAFTALKTTIASFAVDSPTDQLQKIFSASKYAQIAIAIGVLVAGLSKLATLDSQGLAQGVAAIAVVLGMLMGVFAMINKMTKTAAPAIGTGGGGEGGDFAKTMLGLGVGVGLMAMAVAKLGELDTNAILKGEIAVATLGTFMLGFIKVLDMIKANNVAGTAATMLLVSAGITSMIVPVSILSALPLENLLKGVGAVSTIMLAFGALGMMIKSTDWSTLLAAGASFAIISAGLLAITASISALTGLAALNGEAMMQSVLQLEAVLVTILGLVGIIGGAAKGGGGTMLAAAASFAAISASLLLVAGALAAFQALEWETLGKGAAILGAILAAGAVGTIVAAGLGAIAAVFSSLALAIGAVALAAVGFGAGVALIASGAMNLVAAFGSLILIGKTFGEELPTYMGYAVEGIRVAIYGILDIIATATTPMFQAGLALIKALVMALEHSLPDILNGVMLLATGVLAVVAKLGGPLAEAIIEVIDTLTEYLPKFMDAIGNFLTTLFYEIGKLLHELCKGLISMIVALFTGEDTFNLLSASGQSAGAAVGTGYAQGIGDSTKDVEKSAEDMTNAAIDTVRKTQDSHSPSKVFRQEGQNAGLGAILGVEDMIPSYEDMWEQFANAGLNSFSSTMLSGLTQWQTKLNTAKRGLGVKKKTSAEQYQYDARQKRQRELLGIPEKEQEEIEEEFEDFGFDLGSSMIDSIGSGIKKTGGSGGKAAKAAKDEAKTISDAFQEELDKIKKDEEVTDLLYKLWTAENPNAKEVERHAKQIEYQTAKVNYQLKRTEATEKQYMETLEKMGETADETHEAYVKYLEEQVELVELQNELANLQKEQVSNTNDSLESFQKFSSILASYDVQWLNSLGWTNQQIAEAAAKEAGYMLPKTEEALKGGAEEAIATSTEAISETVDTSAKQIGEAYSVAIGEAVQLTENGTIETLGESAKRIGEAYSVKIGEALMQSGTSTMVPEATAIGEAYSVKIGEAYATDIGEAYSTAIDTHINTQLPILAEEGVKTYSDALSVSIANNSGTIVDALQTIPNTIQTTLTDQTETIGQIGTAYVMAIDQAATSEETMTTFTTDMDNFINYIVQLMSDEEHIQKWFDVGAAMMDGLSKGMSSKQQEIENYLMNLIASMLGVVQDTAGIASPSTEFMWMGDMMAEGLAEGIAEGQSEVINAAIELAVQAIQSAQNALGIASPSKVFYHIGRFLDQGFANGITDYSTEVYHASQTMINTMAKEAGLWLNEDLREILGLMGYSANDIALNLIVDANVKGAEGKISEIEAMYYDLERAKALYFSTPGPMSWDKWLKENHPYYDEVFSSYWAAYNDGTPEGAAKAREEYAKNVIDPLYAQYEKYAIDAENKQGAAWQALMNTMDRIEKRMHDGTQTFGEAKYEFTQNIYSPQQLTTVEIYRQTNNQLSRFIGGVKK